jgi:tryptophan-rich sensory protein
MWAQVAFVLGPALVGELVHRTTFDKKKYDEKIAAGLTWAPTKWIHPINILSYACTGLGASFAYDLNWFADDRRMQMVVILQLLLLWSWNVLLFKGTNAACAVAIAHWIAAGCLTALFREVSHFTGHAALPTFAWATFLLNMTFELRDYNNTPGAFTARPEATAATAAAAELKPKRPQAPPGFTGPKRRDGTPLYRGDDKDD